MSIYNEVGIQKILQWSGILSAEESDRIIGKLETDSSHFNFPDALTNFMKYLKS